MTGARVTIEIDDVAAQAALARLAALGADMTPMMDEIGSMVVASTVGRFESGTDPDGKPWKPSQRALKEHGKTLVDSARLMQSMTHQPAPDEVFAGTNVIYAAIHQSGGEIQMKPRVQALAFNKRGRFAKRRSKAVRFGSAAVAAHVVKMPRRAFLGLSEDDRAGIQDIVADHLGKAWQA